ncbi:MAG: hypothetical protein R2712_13260 [Vicinamibacterales bacterium]
MNHGWNYRREHLRLQQRSHYVITNGGDLCRRATRASGHYFRETNYDTVKNLWDIGDKMAEGAALMTNTEWSSRVLGVAWPSCMNRTLAETIFANIQTVGLPKWTEADETLAKATQRELGVPENGLAKQIATSLRGTELIPDETKRGGGSDDIGDISWTVPTASLSFPANFQAGPGHNWANAIAMATPIAHKGTVAGAKVQAMTVIDSVTRPRRGQGRQWTISTTLKQRWYTSFLRPGDEPAIHLNKAIMDRYRPEMRSLLLRQDLTRRTSISSLTSSGSPIRPCARNPPRREVRRVGRRDRISFRGETPLGSRESGVGSRESGVGSRESECCRDDEEDTRRARCGHGDAAGPGGTPAGRASGRESGPPRRPSIRASRVLKDLVDAEVSSPALFDLGQQMNDMLFSFGEIGFQEFETQKYLGTLLRGQGFTVEEGVAGIPTARGAGAAASPSSRSASDIDGIPQGSQKPGVAYHDPLVEGAPGHGEGHNSGTPLNIVAAIAVKRVMEREKLPGTLMIWPGVAEELLGTKAYYVRAALQGRRCRALQPRGLEPVHELG